MARIAHVATIDLSLRFLLLPQLRALRDAGFDVTTISAPGPWVPELEAEGIRHIPWRHATRAWDPRADALAFRELLSIFRRERFDLVHTHNPKPGVMGRIAARAVGVPHVINTVHGLYATPEDRLRRRAPVLAAEWIAARCSDLELYQSAEDLAWARRLHVAPAGRSVLLGNGIDLSQFSPASPGRSGSGSSALTWGSARTSSWSGRSAGWCSRRATTSSSRPPASCATQVPNARFLAVGQSDPDKPDSVTAERIELAREDVIFTGWREDVADLMALMDVFVLPSWREGLPRSAIEAAASGLPLVLTDIRGCREVARDGVEGFLVPVRDPVRLADAVLRLLEDPELRRRMGAAARRRAEEAFDERRVVSTVVAATRRLVHGRGADAVEEDAGIRIRAGRVADVAGHGEAPPGVDADRVPPDAGRRGSCGACIGRRRSTGTR